MSTFCYSVKHLVANLVCPVVHAFAFLSLTDTRFFLPFRVFFLCTHRYKCAHASHSRSLLQPTHSISSTSLTLPLIPPLTHTPLSLPLTIYTIVIIDYLVHPRSKLQLTDRHKIISWLQLTDRHKITSWQNSMKCETRLYQNCPRSHC